MWKKAVESEKKAVEFQKIVENSAPAESEGIVENLEKKSQEFEKILEVSKEERDRIQRMQVIDRATAARALLKESGLKKEESGSGEGGSGGVRSQSKLELGGLRTEPDGEVPVEEEEDGFAGFAGGGFRSSFSLDFVLEG